jgi:hypothetical protein
MKECKCGNYKPYSDTIEDSVIYAPAMPLDACVNCSGVRYDLTALQKENDELRAYSNRLANALVICDAQHEGSYIGGGLVREVLDETPAQSLAEVKADAVMSILDNVNDFEAFGSPKMMEVSDIIEYANKLKGGE